MLRIPLVWRLAGALHRIPEFRGRDRITGLLLAGTEPPAGRHTGIFGPNLRYNISYRDDGSFVEFFFLQYEEPSLIPVLRATLKQGDVFFDVGANVGIYAAWGARLVGPTGEVHAFEPAPFARKALDELISLNDLRNVVNVPMAVADVPGTVSLHILPGASGLTSALAQRAEPQSTTIRVPTTTLDEYIDTAGCRTPTLVMIDVEGAEADVIRGSEKLARTSGPVFLFESFESHFSQASRPFGDLVRWLDRVGGYHVYGLTPRGLQRINSDTAAPVSANSVALHPLRHADELRRLARQPFRRNQTC